MAEGAPPNHAKHCANERVVVANCGVHYARSPVAIEGGAGVCAEKGAGFDLVLFDLAASIPSGLGFSRVQSTGFAEISLLKI
jgi:hypothetical protein